MTLSAKQLDIMDRCERRFAFEKRYSSRLISPLGLLYQATEAALISPDPEQQAKDTTMHVASTHDLILGELNSFFTIRHCGYLSGIIALALRKRLGMLKRVESTADWDSGLFETESGTRHRIELVSHFDDDRLRACAHSWRVVGELAALETNLTLTAVVIGPQRTGRRHSEWSKAFRHPINHELRFAPRNSKKSGFTDGWMKVWREMESGITTERWLEQMNLDGVMDSLIVSREIAYKPDDHRMIAARKDMGEIAERMKTARMDSPMRRSSCDEFGGCPFSACCYSATAAHPGNFPALYQLKALGKLAVKPIECTSEHRTAV
jgi:hypothetical protein